MTTFEKLAATQKHIGATVEHFIESDTRKDNKTAAIVITQVSEDSGKSALGGQHIIGDQSVLIDMLVNAMRREGPLRRIVMAASTICAMERIGDAMKPPVKGEEPKPKEAVEPECDCPICKLTKHLDEKYK